MDQIILIIGLVISPLVTIIGLVLNHKANLKTAEILAKKTLSEANKIEQEADELEIKNRLAQLTYYIKITEDLRADVAQLRKENYTLSVDNIALRERVSAQETQIKSQEQEIITLREKVRVLENKPV